MAIIHWYGEYNTVREYDIPIDSKLISKVKEKVEWDLKENLEPNIIFPEDFDWSEENIIRIFGSNELLDYEEFVRESICDCINTIVFDNWPMHTIAHMDELTNHSYICI